MSAKDPNSPLALPGMIGAEPPRASRMAAGDTEIYAIRLLSGAGSLDEILVELNPAARLCLAVLPFGDNGESAVFQPGNDPSKLCCVEQPNRLLNSKPTPPQQVGEDFTLWIACHILP